jgi:GH15 family glucan-1,4-alpha-glucosidase
MFVPRPFSAPQIPNADTDFRYTIHGGKEIEEMELPHLDGHKGQKPVRVGNGAANHLQLDIYGELLDASAFTCLVPISLSQLT